MSLESKRIPVTLCCAQDDASDLRPLVIHLEQEGYKVRVIEGIEDDPYLLGSALDRQLGACVIVACLSDALGPSQFRRIEGVFNARKGPDHSLETIFVEPDETLAMAESVRAAVSKAKERRPEPNKTKAASESGARLRDVVGVTSLSAVGTDAIPSTGVAASDARSRPAEALPLGNPSPVTEAENAGAAEAEAGEGASLDPGASQSMAGQSMAGQSLAGQSVVGPRQAAGWVAPVLFLIFLAVAGTVVLLLLQDKQSNSQGGRGAPSLPADSGGDEAEAPEPDSSSETGGASETRGTGAPSGETEGGSETGEGPVSGGPVDESARIVEAIEKGEMRAIDLILIANTSELSAWRDASNRCRNKSVNGVRGWRLPTLTELKTMRKARLVAKGDRYWSSTLAKNVGTGSDHVYVLDLDKQAIEPVSKEAEEVRVLCVRSALQPSE